MSDWNIGWDADPCTYCPRPWTGFNLPEPEDEKDEEDEE